jgi:hypothetical protein
METSTSSILFGPFPLCQEKTDQKFKVRSMPKGEQKWR